MRSIAGAVMDWYISGPIKFCIFFLFFFFLIELKSRTTVAHPSKQNNKRSFQIEKKHEADVRAHAQARTAVRRRTLGRKEG